MVKKRSKKILSFAMAFSMIVSGISVSAIEAKAAEPATKLTEEDLTAALNASESVKKDVIDNNGVSVHDPSIIKNENPKAKEGKYYAFGSHMAVAKTDDLATWTQVSTAENDPNNTSLFGSSFNEAFKNNAFTGNVKVKEGEEAFGTYDASAWNTARAGYTVSGNMWAPDVIYNKKMGKYCMYLSLNGQAWNSVVILLTSEDIEGPYIYQGPVVYTGFSTSEAALSYKNTDLEKVYGTLSSLPEQYMGADGKSKADDGTWGEYLPHAIDPAVFYDTEGNLRLVYGSWSGGIYELELDEDTGLRDYTVQYELKYSSDNKRDMVSDPYFGIHIAGGYYVSGEGPYVEVIDGRYYLFMSYGGFDPSANYQMRIFSSDKPEGPYVDSNGVSAIYNEFQVNYNTTYGDCYDGTAIGELGTTRGSRLMTSYKWDTMGTGEIGQGHNSAITVDGKSFVIYHTKYDNGTYAHNIRTHELYTVDGWLVAAPYQYDASIKDKGSYGKAEVSGNYDVIFSKYDTNKHWVGGQGGTLENSDSLDCETPEIISFSPDGKVVSGVKEIGNWALDSDGKHMTIAITSNDDEHLVGTYKAVVIEQNADGEQKTCFTGINKKTGISIWGTFNNNNEVKAIALTEKNMKVDIPSKTYDSLKLPTKGLSGATITWTSSNTNALANDGTVKDVNVNTPVTLTEKISCGNYYYEKSYDVTVGKKGTTSIDLTNGAKEPVDNPFYGQDSLDTLYIKYTIIWASGAWKNGWDGLMSFYNSTTNGRVSIQCGPYVCYNQMDGTWKDIKYMASNGIDMRPMELEFGKDYTYEIIITKEDCVIKENGEKVNLSVAGEASYWQLLDYIRTQCDKFSWGTTVDVNSFWATEKCKLYDVVVNDKSETVNEVLNKISEIGDTYTSDSVKAIEAAKAAYDALSDDEKKEVPEDVVAQLEKAVKDLNAAREVEKKINAIGKVTSASAAAIAEAEKAYEALGDAKALVSEDVVKKLEDAKKALEKLQGSGTGAAGTQVTDKTSKAVYTITKAANAKGKGGEVEYKKSTDAKATSVKIPATIKADGITYKVTKIAKNAFLNNKKMTKVTIGTNIVAIGKNAFKNCTKLKTVTMKTTKLTTIGAGAFQGDKVLKSINLSKCTKLKTIGASAFQGDKALKSVNLSKCKKLTSIGAGAFKGDTALTSISLTKCTKLTSIGASAFQGDTALKSIDLSKSVVKTIGKNAFSGCKKLAVVKLNGNTLKTVKKNAFKSIKKNAKIIIVTKKKANYNKVVKAIKKSGAKNVRYSQAKK